MVQSRVGIRGFGLVKENVPSRVSQHHLYIPPIKNENKMNIGIKKGYREEK